MSEPGRNSSTSFSTRSSFRAGGDASDLWGVFALISHYPRAVAGLEPAPLHPGSGLGYSDFCPFSTVLLNSPSRPGVHHPLLGSTPSIAVKAYHFGTSGIHVPNQDNQLGSQHLRALLSRQVEGIPIVGPAAM
jgi:hypothetical protein